MYCIIIYYLCVLNKNILMLDFSLTKSAPYIIVIGDTGVGKSSLIKLLTNYNNIATSNKAQSCTMNTTFYGAIEVNVCFVDTRGTEDSDSKTDDKEILNNIQQLMHDYNGSMCKIIWIVHAAERGNKHLRAQLSFIQELGNATKEGMKNDDNINFDESKSNINEPESKTTESNIDTGNNKKNNDFNIWNSVLMIVNKPKAHTSLKSEIKGIDFLAIEYGCSSEQWKIGENLIGFTNLSWMGGLKGTQQAKEKKRMEKALKKELAACNDSDDSDDEEDDDPGHHGNALHYYHDQDIKKLVYDNLDKHIETFKLLSLSYKCTKCGIQGNPKFVGHLRCHTKCEKCHPHHGYNIKYTHLGENQKLIHPGIIEKKHSQGLRKRYHKGKVKKRHKSEAMFSIGGKIVTGLTAVGVGAGAAAGAVVAASGKHPCDLKNHTSYVFFL